MTHATPERIMVLRIPDWPVHAFLQERAQRLRDDAAETSGGGGSRTLPGAAGRPGTDALPGEHPTARAVGVEQAPATTPALPRMALAHRHLITACTPAARAAGVRVGVREREAQLRCPELEVHPHDAGIDARRFAGVVGAVEELIPGVEELRPGLCAVRARGPARYYGGEHAAALALLARARELGYAAARVGIADGRFAAAQAAMAALEDPGVEQNAAEPAIRLVRTECTATFLAALPVSRVADPAFADTLLGLGIRTLGAFAALPADAVAARFGAAGTVAHRLASGRDGSPGAGALHPRTVEPDLSIVLDLDQPVESSEQLAFACSARAESLVHALRARGLVCTELRVELIDDLGVRYERLWAHPAHFTAADMVNRVRWQAAALADDTPQRQAAAHAETRERSGVVGLRLAPARTERMALHEPGLWNAAPDERVHHHLSRVQSLLGHEGAGTAELTGGRLSGDRQRFVPWGTRRTNRGAAPGRGGGAAAWRPRDGPWPGSLSSTAPNTVFTEPLPAALLSAEGREIGIDEEELLDAKPAAFVVSGVRSPAPVVAWSSPWPLRERWWASGQEAGEPTGVTRFRLQLLLENGDAWLVFRDRIGWFAEGRYR